MRAFYTLLVMLSSHVVFFAQTPTPNLGLVPLSLGYYEAEELSFPYAYIDAIALSSNGVILQDGNFAFQANGDVFVTFGGEDEIPCEISDVTICVGNEQCLNVRSANRRTIFVQSRNFDTIAIYAECIVIDAVQVISSLATAEPEMTPTPSPYIYAEISNQVTRFDYVVTAGDVAVTLTLAALLASIVMFVANERS